jgi:hypothetical protein
MLQTRSVAGQLIAETQVIIGDSPHTFLTLQGIHTSSSILALLLRSHSIITDVSHPN